MKLEIAPTPKQYLVWKELLGGPARYILFGGGAGGGKTWLVCEWITYMCLQYPGTKWFIAREELKRLMGSTFITLMKVFAHHKIPYDSWTLNGQYNYLTFSNGSRIDFLDVKALPGDPLYERFGSLEFTGGAIEEVGEVEFEAFDVLKSRVNRWLNRECSIPAKILLTCNPKRNWTYNEFYLPHKKGELDPSKTFIQALYNENPYTAKEYGKSLADISDPVTKARLMYGEWEYDDDPNKLFEYAILCDIFTRQGKRWPERFLTSDVARFGKDNSTILIWEGLQIIKATDYHGIGTDVLEQKIEEHREQFNIARSHCVADDDGVGGSVPDHLKGVVGFVNNGRPIEVAGRKQNFSNLKSQCYFALSEAIARGDIGCYPQIRPELKQMIIDDLQQVKQAHRDDDSKPLAVISKEEMKEKLGRSPDLGDTLMMRMLFELKKPSKMAIAGWASRGQAGHADSRDLQVMEHIQAKGL